CVLGALSLSQQGVMDVQKPNGQQAPVSLMLLTFAASGERKSSVENVSFEAIRTFEKIQRDRYHEKYSVWKAKHDAWKARRRALLRAIEKRVASGLPSAQEEFILVEIENDEPRKPKRFKLIYENSTTEALYSGLNENSSTAGLISSEGGGVLNSTAFNDFTKQNAIWSGDPITVDLKTRPSFDLTGGRLTVDLMVQREVFDKHQDKRGGATRGSGLWARYLVAEPITTQGTRFISNSTQSWEHRENYNARIKEILEENDSTQETPGAERQLVKLNSEACERWLEMTNAIEAEIRPGGRFEHAGDHAAKLADNIVRVAANLHKFENFEGDISRETLEVAINIGFWHSDQFLDIFLAPPQEVLDTNELYIWLNNSRSRGHRYIRKNHIRQYGPNRIREKHRLQVALNFLQCNGEINTLVVGKVAIVDLMPWYPNDDGAMQIAIFGQVRGPILSG
ncbi:MAG: YfjI family protein, partial [Cyclobacteriaceae bacterium]